MNLWLVLLEAVRGLLFGLSHVFGGSLAMGIIALSLLTRLALLPWSLRAARRAREVQARLRALEPRLRRIRTRFAGDPRRLHDATLAEYRRAGVNPLGTVNLGLMAVQVPLAFALYSVIRSGLDAGGAFLWIADLAAPDALLSLVVGGLSTLAGATLPSAGGPLPGVLGAAAMGVFAGVMVFHLSAGVALYWASTSTVGIVQNLLLRRSSAPAT